MRGKGRWVVVRNLLNKIQEFKIELEGGFAIAVIMLLGTNAINAALEIIIAAQRVLIFIMKHAN